VDSSAKAAADSKRKSTIKQLTRIPRFALMTFSFFSWSYKVLLESGAFIKEYILFSEDRSQALSPYQTLLLAPDFLILQEL
jgi:hypothetical protein